MTDTIPMTDAVASSAADKPPTASSKPARRKRVWVQNVAVAADAMETRLDVAAAQGLGPDQEAAAAGVRKLLRNARDAANNEDPRPGRWGNWWRGTLVDAAHQNIHAARAQIVEVYNEADLAAEIPSVVARAQMTLALDDPRRIDADKLRTMPVAHQRAFIRRSIEDAFDEMDRRHERLRSFRNIILLSSLVMALLVTTAAVFVAWKPTILPLCFPSGGPAQPGAVATVSCPTGGASPTGGDVLVVGLLGLLGGALSAALSIRNLRGTSTPYDVPVALAMLKVPLGAFTAILGLIAIQGEFVPGLSVLDSQGQILAYALLLGFAQQVFTRLLDRRAQDLLDGIPSKDDQTASARGGSPVPPVTPPTEPRPGEPGDEEGQEEGAEIVLPPADALPNGARPQEEVAMPGAATASPAPAPASGATALTASAPSSTAAATATAPTDEDTFQQNPQGDDEPQEQDDDEAPRPNPPEQDFR
jgi:hypothetical protein